MDETIEAQEQAYWRQEVEQRTADLLDVEAKGEGPARIAALRLRLEEAKGRRTAT